MVIIIWRFVSAHRGIKALSLSQAGDTESPCITVTTAMPCPKDSQADRQAEGERERERESEWPVELGTQWDSHECFAHALLSLPAKYDIIKTNSSSGDTQIAYTDITN